MRAGEGMRMSGCTMSFESYVFGSDSEIIRKGEGRIAFQRDKKVCKAMEGRA